VDGKPLDKGLNDASKKLDRWHKSMAKAAKGGGGSLLGGGLLAGGPIGVAAAGAGIAGKALFEEFISNPRTLADAMQKASDLSAKSLEQFTARMEQSRAAMARLDEIAATPAAMQARRDELSKVESELGGLADTLHAARAEYEKLDSAFNSAGNAGLWMTAPLSGGLEGQREQLRPQLQEAEKKYNEALKRRIELQKQLNDLSDPQKNQAAKDSIESFTKSLRDQVKQLEQKNTLTKEDLELQKMAQKFGWGDGHFRTQDAKTAIEELRTAEANDALDAFTKAMKDQTERIVRADLSDEDFELRKLGNKVDPNSGHLSWAREALAERKQATNLENARQWFAGEQQRQAAMTGPAARGAFQFASAGQFFGTAGAGVDRLARNQEKQLVKLDQVIAAVKAAGLFIQ